MHRQFSSLQFFLTQSVQLSEGLPPSLLLLSQRVIGEMMGGKLNFIAVVGLCCSIRVVS